MSYGKPAILLYDGVCGLCNWLVTFTIKRDRAGKFKFASLQSEAGRTLLQKFNLPVDDFDSMVLIKGDKSYRKSAAALRILKELTWPYKLFYLFIIIPAPIADFFYGIIARNRYKWFGKHDECLLPSPEIKERFIS